MERIGGRADPRKAPRRLHESLGMKMRRALQTFDYATAEPSPRAYDMTADDIRKIRLPKNKLKVKSTVQPSWKRGQEPQPPKKPQPQVDWRTAKKVKPSGKIDDADYHPEHYIKR
jgi:hypothetical protein